jgi:GT2 family glycosyltransferase
MIEIILLNYNSSLDCVKCVSCIKQQQRVDYEIIIVDNNSSEIDKQQIKKLSNDEGCTLLCSTENRGYSAGNNVGLRYAAQKGYEYALIINPDMELYQSDYLQRLTAIMQQDDAVVVAGTDIVNTEGRHQNPMLLDNTDWRSEWGWIKEFVKNFFHCKQNKQYDFVGDYTRSGYCGKLSGCCFLIRISFLRSIDFFDEYPFLYCEEAILARQVQALGHKMYYAASIQAFHKHISSTKGNPTVRFKQFSRSRKYYLLKYSNIDGWRLYAALFSRTLNLWILVLTFRITSFYKKRG